MVSDDKTCFVIAPIGQEGSDTRERSDTVFEEVIKEVVEEFNYECIRADHIDEPGIITNQVIEYVVESELVIADLTNKNPNVFYELAVRHAHQRPIIQLINRNDEIPFDVATQRTINIDLEDFSTTNRAQRQIRNQITEIESNGFEVQNPVSVAGHIRDLKQSGEPEKQQLAEFTKLLNEINTKVRSLENTFEKPEKILPPEYLEQLQNKNIQEIDWLVRELTKIDTQLENLYMDIQEDNYDRDRVLEEVESIGRMIREVQNSVSPDFNKKYALDDYRN